MDNRHHLDSVVVCVLTSSLWYWAPFTDLLASCKFYETKNTRLFIISKAFSHSFCSIRYRKLWKKAKKKCDPTKEKRDFKYTMNSFHVHLFILIGLLKGENKNYKKSSVFLAEKSSFCFHVLCTYKTFTGIGL